MVQLTLAGYEFEPALGAVRRPRENGTGTARFLDEIAPKTDQISMNTHS